MQLPPEVEHAGGGAPGFVVPVPGSVAPGSAQRPSTQLWLQQSVAAVAVVQLPPVSLHVGEEVASRHAWKAPPSPHGMHVRPEQQLVSLAPVQDAPKGVQVEPPGVLPPPHRRTPAESGTHGSKLQH